MRARKHLFASAAMGLQDRALGVVRPGVEALLLAAVALGVAQAGWSLIAPGSAGASGAPRVDDPVARTEPADIRSPFAPEAAGLDSASHAAAALLSSIQLAGVRVSTDSSRSGAMLTMGDGAQRAFSVGQEIAPGVTLAEVTGDYVTVSFAGGQRQLNMTAAPEFSFARALLGHADALNAVAAQAAPAPGAEIVAGRVTPFSQGGAREAQRAWFTNMLASAEAEGWRVAGPLPSAARAAGLREGDLITAVNGVGPGDPAAVLAAASSGSVQLTVRRGRAGAMVINVAADQPT